jgi:hypothetical protein
VAFESLVRPAWVCQPIHRLFVFESRRAFKIRRALDSNLALEPDQPDLPSQGIGSNFLAQTLLKGWE